MPTWIREQDAARAFDSPTASSSSYSSSLSPTKLPVKKKTKKTSTADLQQTNLLSHFATNFLGGEEKQMKSPSCFSALYTNEGRSSADHTPQTGRKRKGAIEEGLQSKRPKSIGRERIAASTLKEREPEASTKNDAAIPSYLAHVFGLAPQSSLSQQSRTPRRKSPWRKETTTPAPAISPSRKRTLIVDSARDVAVQQHRQWQRSSSPLQSIDNTVASPRSAQKKESPPSRQGTRLTPSKLRHGYSMMALVQNEKSEDDGEGEEEDDSINVEDSPSPSAERHERAVATPKNVSSRNTDRQKRIYVQETQHSPANRLFRQEIVQDREESVNTNRSYSADIISEQVLFTDVDLQKGASLFDNLESLSSPPPSTTGLGMRAEEAELKSSQTAPGGSFNLSNDVLVTAIDSYVSEEEEIDEDQRRQAGDETFKLPSSQDLETPIKVADIKSRLRSSTKTIHMQPNHITEPLEEDEQDESDETQLLPWSPCNEQNEQRRAISTKERVRASWNDVSRVWSQVSLNDEDDVVGALQSEKGDHQTSLRSFGFEVNKVQKKRKAVEMNKDIDFDSDEGLDSDEEFPEDYESKFTHYEEKEQATQVLPWEGQEEEGAERSSPFSLLPSEGDLDSQARQFLDNL